MTGITHTALTFLFHPDGGEVALWFAGAGLALIPLGLLNLARRAGSYSRVRQLSAVGNVAGVAYMLIVIAMLPAPHVLLIMGMLLVTSRPLMWR